MAVNDLIKFSLESYGGNTVNEYIYHFLGSLGFTGTLSDRLAKYEHEDRVGWQALIRGHGLSNSLGVVRQTLFSDSQQGLIFVPEPVVDGRQVLYKLSDFTDPTTADGDPVGGGQEVSGNDNHLTQSVSADRPTYGTDGTLHWLAGDGVSDNIIGSFTATNFHATSAIWSLSGRFNTLTEFKYLASLGNGTDATDWMGITTQNGVYVLRAVASDGTDVRITSGVSTDTLPHVFTVVFDSGVQRLFVDGVSQGSVSIAAGMALSDAAIGGLTRLAVSAFSDSRVYGKALSIGGEGDRQKVEQYMAKKAGITL